MVNISHTYYLFHTWDNLTPYKKVKPSVLFGDMLYSNEGGTAMSQYAQKDYFTFILNKQICDHFILGSYNDIDRCYYQSLYRHLVTHNQKETNELDMFIGTMSISKVRNMRSKKEPLIFFWELINKFQSLPFKLQFNFFIYPNLIITTNMDEICGEGMGKYGIKFGFGA